MHRTSLLLAALGVLLLTPGCDDAGGTTGDAEVMMDAGRLDGGAAPTPDRGAPAEGIGPEGGELTAPGARLVVPAGALSETVQLTVSIEAPDGTVSQVYDFGPDGLTFETPAQLFIDVADERADLAIAVWQDDGWVALPPIAGPAGAVGGEVEHFSRFGVIVVAEGADPRAVCGLPAPIIAACDGGPVPSRCEEYYAVVTADEVEGACDGAYLPAGCPIESQGARRLLGVCRPGEGEVPTASFVYTDRMDPALLRVELDGAVRGCEGRGLQFCQVLMIDEPAPEPEPEPEPVEGPNACDPDGFTASCPFEGANSCTDYHQGYAVETLQQVCNGQGGNPSFSETPCTQEGAIGKCEAATLPGQNCATTWIYPPADPDLSRQICQGRWTDL